jgi:hypothetical protein
MKNRVIILTAALLLAMSLSAHAQIGGILRQIADAVDGTGSNQTQQQQTQQQPTLDKLSFSLIDRNTASSVKQVNKDVSGAVVIPDTYDGKPVTAIGDFNNNKITSVILGKNVTGIAMFAFGLPSFSSITFPASVQKIGNGAFNTMSSNNLTSVTFEGNSAEFSSAAFPGGASLLEKYQAGGAGTYTRNGNIWSAASGAVTQQPTQPTQPTQSTQSTDPTLNKLSYTQINGQWRIAAVNKSISGDVVIPSTWDSRNVQYVAAAGFEDCTRITSITFPATIIAGGVGASAFVGCTNLPMVTFRGNRNDILNQQAFEGDLYAKYRAGGSGNYTRDRGGRDWTKID